MLKHTCDRAALDIIPGSGYHQAMSRLLDSQSLLKERYLVAGPIGQGGMGAVYRAEDTLLAGRFCAVKEIAPDPDAGEESLVQLQEQFRQEASVLARLDHPNLPKVSDYFTQSGREYLVMDYVPGHNLRELVDQALSEGLKMSPDEARTRRLELADDKADPQQVSQAYSLMEHSLDTMVEQLTQCLRYYESVFRNQSIERAIFVGGQAYDKRLCGALARRLNLPAQVGDPLVRIQRSPGCEANVRVDCRQPQPGWAVAVGLSIGATVAA